MSLYSSNIYHSCEKKEKRRRGKKLQCIIYTVVSVYQFYPPPLTSQATDFTSRGRGGAAGRRQLSVSLPPSALAA